MAKKKKEKKPDLSSILAHPAPSLESLLNPPLLDPLNSRGLLSDSLYEDPANALLVPRCWSTRTSMGMAHSGDVIRTELGTYCDAHGLQPYGSDNV